MGHKNEEFFHIEFIKKMIKTRIQQKEDETASAPSAPLIPPIHLYNLHRRRVFLELLSDETGGIQKLVFHVFDVDDDLTFSKMSKITKAILEFMAHHKLYKKFNINVYSWNKKKKDLYKERFKISISTILRQKFYTDKFTADAEFRMRVSEIYEKRFKGHNFISLEIDRFLYEKGKHY